MEWECFPQRTTGNSPVYRETPSLLLSDFLLVCVNWSIFSQYSCSFITRKHAHAYTHTCSCIHNWRFHSHLWTLVSRTRSLTISITWNVWMSNKTHLKRKAKLKTVIKTLELRNVLFALINICFYNFLLLHLDPEISFPNV